MTRTILASAALLIFTVGCSTQGAEGERGPLGKADTFGTCQDACGGPSLDGNCWCDDQCESIGDCCEDKVEICEAEAASCGGFAGLTCGEGEYCHYEESETCGAADQLGTCVVRPEICPEIFGPVCGCDGETYSNDCFAHAAGTSVAHTGECADPDPAQCGGFAGLTCGEGEYCHYEESEMCGAADQLGECQTQPQLCPEIFAPVCGCDGQTYSNDCFAHAAGTSVAHAGEC